MSLFQVIFQLSHIFDSQLDLRTSGDLDFTMFLSKLHQQLITFTVKWLDRSASLCHLL